MPFCFRCGFLLGFLGAVELAEAQNYFPEPIAPSDFSVGIETYATVPDSSDRQPPRISVLTWDPLGRIFANDQRGPLYLVEGRGTEATEYLDLRDHDELALISTFEAGFQSFAFHPDFAESGRAGFGRFYTIHSSAATNRSPDFDPGGGTSFHSLLLEWQTGEPTAAKFVPLDENQPYREVLRFDQPYGNHNTGLIDFNPMATAGDDDFGNLYVAVGDGGSGGDPQENGQKAGNPFGAILRIDPLGSDAANGQYGIVSQNLFAADDSPVTLAEVYSYGLRNPQRFGWDTATGNLFIADIGQNTIEEINLGTNGGNFGWNKREGSFAYRSDDTADYLNPAAEYDHSNLVADPPTRIRNRAVTTGEVARGTGIPDLDGHLLLADFPTGSMFVLDVDTDPLDGGQDGLRELQIVDATGPTNLIDLVNEVRADRGLSRASRVDLRFSVGSPSEVFVTNKHDGVIRRFVLVSEPSTGAIWALGALGMTFFWRRR